MVYIYDILLNFNKNLLEYFEWEETDSIKYIKKVPLFKVNTKFIKDIIYKIIILDDSFINKVPKYEMNGMKDAGSVCLFTDGSMVVGVFLKNGSPVNLSRLLLDEEQEVLEISENMNLFDINYCVKGNRNFNRDNLTRKENNIKESLFKEFKKLFVDKKYDKLLYLYYEYTNKEGKNVEYVYNFLCDSLNTFNDRHIHIYDILLLSNVNLSKK